MGSWFISTSFLIGVYDVMSFLDQSQGDVRQTKYNSRQLSTTIKKELLQFAVAVFTNEGQRPHNLTMFGFIYLCFFIRSQPSCRSLSQDKPETVGTSCSRCLSWKKIRRKSCIIPIRVYLCFFGRGPGSKCMKSRFSGNLLNQVIPPPRPLKPPPPPKKILKLSEGACEK